MAHGGSLFGEEADAAYDRVGLSSYVGGWDTRVAALPGNDYARDELVELRIGRARTAIDRDAQGITSRDGSN